MWVSAILALLWTWTGVAYHWAFFAVINRAAWASARFVWLVLSHSPGLVSPGDASRSRSSWANEGCSAGVIAFALVVYPALGVLVGITTRPHRHSTAVSDHHLHGRRPAAGDARHATLGLCRSGHLGAIGASAAFLLGVYRDRRARGVGLGRRVGHVLRRAQRSARIARPVDRFAQRECPCR